MAQSISPMQPEERAKQDRWIIITLAVAGLLLCLCLTGGGLVVGFGLDGIGPLAGLAPDPTLVPSPSVAPLPEGRTAVSVDDDPSLGPVDAPVLIVEFGDYQCPFSGRWHDEVLDRLMEEYGDNIRFVYRDLPLTSIHPQAQAAAEAADCAGEQGAYWDYQSALFRLQSDLGPDMFLQSASSLGIDTSEFAACLEGGRYRDEVLADIYDATAVGVNATPTFFVNGIVVVGAQPYDVFQEIIDQELARLGQ